MASPSIWIAESYPSGRPTGPATASAAPSLRHPSRLPNAIPRGNRLGLQQRARHL